jgi:hypothetical protein
MIFIFLSINMIYWIYKKSLLCFSLVLFWLLNGTFETKTRILGNYASGCVVENWLDAHMAYQIQLHLHGIDYIKLW